ncbi:uncharacterized protein I303_105628 [Kwoniella dejecticola CBS 10117]|uniref:Major facilitator superfamily (MFS) profile domain-containing protein n=1 Tax=Kwoniella dejecticola CBS 10117 TaxID=1296121 RepID=A0A1A6A1Y7_9TREE|nr:uncharacterized protein I303_04928 [Kwoniella dejecticola CBS 10117]OBR84072.1 hypothetical protein I303_04928 [Kwoniella dejecticola CBS 10117]
MAATSELNHYALNTAAQQGIELVRAPSRRISQRSERGPRVNDEKHLETSEIPSNVEEDVVEEFVYPEGGYGWVVVGCCMTWAGLTMGWGVSWGVYQAYYAEYTFSDQVSKLSLVGGLFALLQNTVSFVTGKIGDKFGVKKVLFASIFISWLGVFLASWSTKLWQVTLTQGVIVGIGMGSCQPVYFSLPSQWFYKRRGLASGLAVAGAGFGGAIGTLIIRAMLKALGPHKTLLIYSFINLTLMTIATLLIRTQPNSPAARAKGKGPWIDKRIWRLLPFQSLVLCMILNTFGYITVLFFLTQYIKQLNDVPKSDILGALPLSLLNFCAGVGRISIGYAADRCGAMNTFIFVCLGSSAAVFALWLPATSYNVIIAFGIIYGLIAPTFFTLLPMVAAQVFGPENLASNIGILLLFTAPGGLGGGLVGGQILNKTGDWKWLIVYAALLHAVAGMFMVTSQSPLNSTGGC